MPSRDPPGSIEFSVDAGPSRAARRLILAAHLSGATGLLVFAAMLATDGMALAGAATLLGAGALVALSLDRARWLVARGRLSVDSDGAARWQAEGGAQAPIRPLRWHRIGSLAWIDASDGGTRVRILLGRDRVGDEDWRRLGAWLRWMDRGGTASRI